MTSRGKPVIIAPVIVCSGCLHKHKQTRDPARHFQKLCELLLLSTNCLSALLIFSALIRSIQRTFTNYLSFYVKSVALCSLKLLIVLVVLRDDDMSSFASLYVCAVCSGKYSQKSNLIRNVCTGDWVRR